MELFDTSQMKRPPLRWYGAKWRLAPWVVSLMPPHRCYAEVFGGAAGVLLRKERSQTETYNDLDGQVVGFWRVLRDPVTRRALCEAVAHTPFAREEFVLSYEPADCPVEAARRFVFRCYAGHGTCSIDPTDSNGFRSGDTKAGKSYAREWAGVPLAIAQAAERMVGVSIEQLDFRRFIPRFDLAEALIYADPPYPMATRSAGGKGYVHEMSDADHRELAWFLRSSRAKCMVSTYQNDLYEALYKGWRREECQARANGQRGAVTRTEVMYLNY